MRTIQYLIAAALVLYAICCPVLAAQPDGDRMEDIGQRAAYTAMNELGFTKGDAHVVVLTNAGRAIVNGKTTGRTLSGISDISGLENGRNTLWVVNRPDYKPVWFYFYNKNTGKGLYLEPDTAFYTMKNGEASSVAFYDTWSKKVVVNGDLIQMLADTDMGNKTMKDMGGNSGVIAIANGWAHGAPYDMLTAVMLHNHFCPGVSSGYILAKYVEQKMPITDGKSYVVISSPTWCKDDIFPMLWDTTPGKGGQYRYAISDADQEKLAAKYGVRPAGIYILWDSKAKSGHAMLLGFNFDSTEWTGPSWGQKPKQVLDMIENIGTPEKYVVVIKEFEVDEEMLKKLEDTNTNPYTVLGDL
ncbi:MAG: hypothetical protein GX651_01615 [Methanomicrobiales archaeon]|nr:hypothetical protein [Methanomicrobiales archaeon]